MMLHGYVEKYNIEIVAGKVEKIVNKNLQISTENSKLAVIGYLIVDHQTLYNQE